MAQANRESEEIKNKKKQEEERVQDRLQGRLLQLFHRGN